MTASYNYSRWLDDLYCLVNNSNDPALMHLYVLAGMFSDPIEFAKCAVEWDGSRYASSSLTRMVIGSLLYAVRQPNHLDFLEV